MANGDNIRQIQWTESIAVGSQSFIDTIKDNLGIRAKGRKILKSDEGFQLREDMGTYIADYDSKNDDIGAQNGYLWDIRKFSKVAWPDLGSARLDSPQKNDV